MEYFTVVRKVILTETVEVLAESKEDAKGQVDTFKDVLQWNELANTSTYQVTES